MKKKIRKEKENITWEVISVTQLALLVHRWTKGHKR